MRLDSYIVDKLNLSRSKAADLIKLGHVRVNNIKVTKPAFKVGNSDQVDVDNIFKYVSRSGLKLEDAILTYNLNFKDKVILDIGSSKGGFTECSLNYGARKVIAYDVGKDQMDNNLRNHPKVELYEETNILDVKDLNADICLIDVSFTSIRPIINHVKSSCKLFIMLFKPQFEVGPKHIYGGIVKNETIILKEIDSFKSFLNDLGIVVRNYKASELKGKKGNQEYLFIGEVDA